MSEHPGDHDPILCRCEEIRLREVEKAIEDGCCSFDQVKKVTRAGMGFCQGRSCTHAVLQVLENRGHDLTACPGARTRSPVRPVTMGEVAGAPDQPDWPTGGSTSSRNLWRPEELPEKRGWHL